MSLLSTFLLVGGCGAAPVVPDLPEKSEAVLGGELAGGTISDKKWERYVRDAKAATVLVSNEGCGFEATGSGFVVARDMVVTNRHVVEDAKALTVTTPSGSEIKVASWKVARSDDLALLRLKDPVRGALLELDTEDVVSGDLLEVVGYPLGGPLTAGRGQVTDSASDDTEGLIVANLEVLPGNSGGPWIGTSGGVRAVTVALNMQDGSAFGIPAEQVEKLLDGAGENGAPAC